MNASASVEIDKVERAFSSVRVLAVGEGSGWAGFTIVASF
jgi:hypothetical protein